MEFLQVVFLANLFAALLELVLSLWQTAIVYSGGRRASSCGGMPHS